MFPEQKAVIRRERRKWRRLAEDGVSFLRQDSFLPGGFLFRKFSFPSSFLSAGPAKGGEGDKPFRVLFFTDTHIRSGESRSFFPTYAWKGTSLVRENLLEAVAAGEPDAIVFGGDLAGESSCFPEGAALFGELPLKRKFAVYGNWDKKGKTLLSYGERCKMLEKSGVSLLVNEGVFLREDLYLFGLDDTRTGYPLFSLPQEAEKEGLVRLIVSHNPDTVTGRLKEEEIRSTDIFLCGHTHGGQIRIPFFGALRTSSHSGKKLEKGWYIHRETHARMFVSSGIGTTFIQTRIFTPPEIVLLEFPPLSGGANPQ
ncbi:MAG: metallophosphoesterase family protein [Lentisphaeria bacterium]|nr:metallophosphoesterase family protein [Lentisphaeria bacterium]